ncbi:MAG: hypothetical protein WC716_06370 [Chitinophagaceae bacterium]|jgi:hypothetical protein
MTSTLRKLALSAFLSVSALSAVTMTSCNKDPEVCTTGYSGDNCKTVVRTSYYNSYKGSGVDNSGDTYTDWTAKFTELGTDVTKMNLQLLDNKLASVEALTVTLTTNTSFNVDQKVDGSITTTGTGTISPSAVSLTLTQKDVVLGVTTTTTITFSNMVKQ